MTRTMAAARPIRTPSRLSKQITSNTPLLSPSINGEGNSKIWSDPALRLIDEAANMDVDVTSAPGVANLSSGPQASLVLDTNVLLSHLEVIQQFVDDVERTGEPLYIVIPGIVVQELDYQKEDRSRHLCWSARMASTWILSKLRERKSVRGQAYVETLQASGSWKRRDKDTTNDDLIVDCCLYLRSVKQHLVLAISQDHNFCSKAESQGLPTLNPRDFARWSSRSLARHVFGSNYAKLYVFAEYKHSFKPKRVHDALDDDLGIARVEGDKHASDGDGMEVDEDVYSSRDPPPQHLLDDLHEQVLEHFEILLRELLRRVAPPSLFTQPLSSEGTASSIYASPLSSKPAYEWEACDVVEYLCDRRRIPREADAADVTSIVSETGRLIDFMRRRYRARGRSGQHWARADWVLCLSKLGALARAYKDEAIANSLMQLGPQFELVFSMPMRPTGTGYFGV